VVVVGAGSVSSPMAGPSIGGDEPSSITARKLLS